MWEGLRIVCVVHDNTRTTDRSQYIITRTKGCLGVYQVWNGRSSCRATLHLSAEAARSRPTGTYSWLCQHDHYTEDGVGRLPLGFGSGGSPPCLCSKWSWGIGSWSLLYFPLWMLLLPLCRKVTKVKLFASTATAYESLDCGPPRKCWEWVTMPVSRFPGWKWQSNYCYIWSRMHEAKFCLLLPASVSLSNSNSWLFW